MDVVVIVVFGWADHLAVLEFTGSDNEDLIGILSDQATCGRTGSMDRNDLQYHHP